MYCRIDFGSNKHIIIRDSQLDVQDFSYRAQLAWEDFFVVVGGETKALLGKEYSIYTFTSSGSQQTGRRDCIVKTKDKYKFLYSLEKIISIINSLRGEHGCDQWWAMPEMDISNRGFDIKTPRNLYKSFLNCKAFIKHTELSSFYYELDDEILIAADLLRNVDPNDENYQSIIWGAIRELGFLGYPALGSPGYQILELAIEKYKRKKLD